MTDYRMVVNHVRYWRGSVHRWSTSYSFIGSAAAPTAANLSVLAGQDAAMCYPGTGTGVKGGVYNATAYLASGGAPIASVDYFDPDTPGSWLAYNGAGWGTPAQTLETQAEVALLVEWPAGLSSSGKPVTFRKWYHAVPTSSATGLGTPDVLSATLTTLTTQVTALTNSLASSHLLMGKGSRFAGTPVVQGFYGNHQMPRGRRRKALVSSSGKYNGPTIQVPSFPTAIEGD